MGSRNGVRLDAIEDRRILAVLDKEIEEKATKIGNLDTLKANADALKASNDDLKNLLGTVLEKLKEAEDELRTHRPSTAQKDAEMDALREAIYVDGKYDPIAAKKYIEEAQKRVEEGAKERADLNKTAFKLIPDIESWDLETLLLYVQTVRANLLEKDLKSQLDIVKAKNAQIEAYNETQNDINAFASLFPTNADDKATVDTNKFAPKDTDKYEEQWATWHTYQHKYLLNPGYYDSFFGGSGKGNALNMIKGGLETARTTIKGKVDSLSNSQQLDMLRLQSLTNKRNEAFDLMSTFVKRMQDNRSSIISKM